MTRTDVQCASPNAHLLIGEMLAPRQMAGSWREGTGLSIAAHAVVIGILLYAATHVTAVVQTVADASGPLVFTALGHGGGGDTVTGPPRPAAVIAPRPVQVTPVPSPADPAPVPEMHIPVVMTQATQMLPGAPTALNPASLALGPGTGPGGGNGRGTGSGPADGPGIGNGPVDGYGGPIVGPGAGVNAPQLIREVKPGYTAGAMQAKLQGTVEMQALVLPDGTVDPSRLRITRSLDATFGLDQQAIVAVKQWKFRPGTRRGEPVAMWVDVELTFTLR